MKEACQTSQDGFQGKDGIDHHMNKYALCRQFSALICACWIAGACRHKPLRASSGLCFFLQKHRSLTQSRFFFSVSRKKDANPLIRVKSMCMCLAAAAPIFHAYAYLTCLWRIPTSLPQVTCADKFSSLKFHF